MSGNWKRFFLSFCDCYKQVLPQVCSLLLSEEEVLAYTETLGMGFRGGY